MKIRVIQTNAAGLETEETSNFLWLDELADDEGVSDEEFVAMKAGLQTAGQFPLFPARNGAARCAHVVLK